MLFHGTPTAKFRSPDKLIYFSRRYSPFVIYGLMYAILGTRRRLKDTPGINWNNYARKIPASARSRRVGPANYPCNEQIKVVPDAIPNVQSSAMSSTEK